MTGVVGGKTGAAGTDRGITLMTFLNFPLGLPLAMLENKPITSKFVCKGEEGDLEVDSYEQTVRFGRERGWLLQ